MPSDNVAAIVHRVLSEIQIASGRSAPTFSYDLCPMTDLQDFDSLNAVEASCLLSEYLECEIDSDIALFVDNGRARSVREIVISLSEALSANGESHV